MDSDQNVRRSFRRNVDEDILKADREAREASNALKASQRARSLFGGSAEKMGLGNLGRSDGEMRDALDRVERSNRYLNELREYRRMYPDEQPVGSPGRPNLIYKKGGEVKKMAKGGVVKAPSVSRRGDGIAARGKTKGRMV